MLHCYVALESGQTFLKNKYRAHRRQWNLVLIVKVIDTFKPEYLRSKSLMIDFCPAECAQLHSFKQSFLVEACCVASCLWRTTIIRAKACKIFQS